jgi:hypothetical protein
VGSAQYSIREAEEFTRETCRFGPKSFFSISFLFSLIRFYISSRFITLELIISLCDFVRITRKNRISKYENLKHIDY